jgi:hypothetical protein
MQTLEEHVFETFWQAQQVIDLAETNMIIMHARRCGSDTLVLGHKDGFTEYWR